MNARILNKANLQLIAIIAMVMDHTAYFAAAAGYISMYYLMHIIGRITIVIMCYFIAEGYYKTRNLDKYIIRMGLFAIISQIPFYLYKSGAVPTDFYSFAAGNYYNRNVIFTLFTALCLLTVLKSGYAVIIKLAATAAALYMVRCSDWGWACLAWVLVFAFLRDKQGYAMAGAAGIVLLRVVIQLLKLPLAGQLSMVYVLNTLVQAGGVLALPLLRMYNGEKGNMNGKLFYVFYPVHLLLIYIVKLIIL